MADFRPLCATKALVETSAGPVPEGLQELVGEAEDYAAHARAQNTTKAYVSDMRDFATWCAAMNTCALPASAATVALYVSHLARDRKVGTIRRRLVAISQAHKAKGLEPPTCHLSVRLVLKGIVRSKGSAPSQKAALGTAELRALLACTPSTLIGVRDRAVILLGFSAALRRSEIVGLDISDVTFVPEQGLVVRLRRSKTDADGCGRDIAVPYGKHAQTCPVLAVQGWLQQANLNSGPLFRPFARGGQRILPGRLSGRVVARIVQRYVAQIGLDPTLYGGHSLRSGYCTSAAAVGVAEHLIMEVTGHKSVKIMRGYIRQGALFSKCPLREMDL